MWNYITTLENCLKVLKILELYLPYDTTIPPKWKGRIYSHKSLDRSFIFNAEKPSKSINRWWNKTNRDVSTSWNTTQLNRVIDQLQACLRDSPDLTRCFLTTLLCSAHHSLLGTRLSICTHCFILACTMFFTIIPVFWLPFV